MRKKKKFYREPSNTVVVNSYVTELIDTNIEYNDKIKNTFKCKSITGNDKTCIYWERVVLSIGDKVRLKGWWAPNGVFIVKKILVMAGGVKPENDFVTSSNDTPPNVKGGE